jgi:lysosomal acid phosphatase
MKKLLITLSLLMALSFTVSAGDKLVFVTLVTRHGDRTPFTNIENSKYQWNTGYSQLTPIGMNEEFNVGQKLRKRYIDKFKLLAPHYVDDSIYAVSSDANRTILSAESLLLGLYSPGTGPKLSNGEPALPYMIQPIPVRTVSTSSHLIMVPYLQYLKILNKYIYKTKIWQDKEQELQPKFKKWTKILGNKITSLADVISIGDVLIVAEHHNLPLPKGLSKKDAQEIINLTSWGLTTQFKSEKVSYLCGAELLNAMTKNLENAATKKAPYKLTYYSGHDITLLPLMSLLGVSLDKSPGYASHLQIELYEKNNTSYTVKVRYNGKAVKMPIMNNNNSCSLHTFTQYVEKLNNKYNDLNKQ